MREMRDSNVDWEEKIPTEWKTTKIKYLFSSGKGLSITKENLIDEGLPVISYGQIHSKTNTGVSINNDLLRYVDYSYKTNYPRCRVNQFDFVFADTSEDYDGIGNCVYKRDDVELFGGYHSIILRSKYKQDNRYLAYLFKTDAWRRQIRQIASGIKVFSVTQNILMNTSVIIPEHWEQMRIADFLDAKCAEIDALSADIQSEIDTLEAYKRSVITEAVTKGLYKNVPMKDSGIKWVGMIPKHWEVKKIKYTLINRTENNNPIRTTDILSLTAKQGVIPLDEREGGGNKPKEDVSAYRLAYPNDIVMNSMNILSGSVGLSKYFGCVSPVYYMLRPKNAEDDVRYFHDIFQTRVFQRSLRGLGNGILIKETENGTLNTIRMRIPMDKLGNIKLPVPPSNEQRQIADYIDSKIFDIDSILEQKQELLKVLVEYRKSLIYEYVTGKKEVPAV